MNKGEEEVSIIDIKKEIRRQFKEKKKGKRLDYTFLGFIENKELTKEVENLFKAVTLAGYTYYDWVNGNKEMSDLIQKIEIQEAEKKKKRKE